MREQQTDERGFIVEAEGPNGVFGVFEDDGDTGYLYIYEPNGAGILQDLHVYDRSTLRVEITEADVSVQWNARIDTLFA